MLKEFEINLLKKIDESKPTLNTVRTIYLEEELQAIKSLITEGQITIIWDDYIPNLSYQYLELTKSGHVTLFIDTYNDEIKKFVSSFDKLGYDHNLLNDFLFSMDLSKPVEEILTIDNFLWYCNIFDRCEHKSDIILTLK